MLVKHWWSLSFLFLLAALSARYSLQIVRVTRREHRTHVPHSPPSILFWDTTQQQSDVGAPGATKHPKTLEPELPSTRASTPALSCTLPEGGVHYSFLNYSPPPPAPHDFSHSWIWAKTCTFLGLIKLSQQLFLCLVWRIWARVQKIWRSYSLKGSRRGNLQKRTSLWEKVWSTEKCNLLLRVFTPLPFTTLFILEL